MGSRVAWVLVVAGLALGSGAATASADPPGAGQTTTGTVTSNGTEFPFILHTPSSGAPGKPVPLVVMVHGAQTTADQEMRVTGFNQVADQEGFAVLYPDVSAMEAQA